MHTCHGEFDLLGLRGLLFNEAMAAVTLGLVFISSGDDAVAQAILQTLLERQSVEGALDGTWPHFFGVGLGLLFLGQADAADATLLALDAVSHPVGLGELDLLCSNIFVRCARTHVTWKNSRHQTLQQRLFKSCRTGS